jgi:hypothetical protein
MSVLSCPASPVHSPLPADFDVFIDDVEGDLATERADDVFRNDASAAEKVVTAVIPNPACLIISTERTVTVCGNTRSFAVRFIATVSLSEDHHLIGYGNSVDAAVSDALAKRPAERQELIKALHDAEQAEARAADQQAKPEPKPRGKKSQEP